jgi:hypothetical protein
VSIREYAVDDDLLDLIRQLSTRAGMMLEDASVVAVLVGRLSPDELQKAIGEAHATSIRATVLLEAASALVGQHSHQ